MRHLVHVLEATTGGTRRHLRDLVCGLDPLRFRQSLIVSPLRDRSFLDDVVEFRRRGVDVHLVPMRRAPSPFQDSCAALRIARILGQAVPDIVHTHSSKAGILGRWGAMRAGVPLRVHSPHVFAFEMRTSRVLKALFLAVERIAAHWTSALVCVSEAEARMAGELGSHLPPIHVVHNGVEIPEGTPPPLFSGHSPKIALIGRWCVQKGQDTLLSALTLAPSLSRECRVELVGVDSFRPVTSGVRTAAESRLCHLVPPLPPASMTAYLETVDVVVLPSRWEGLPYTLLEAMAVGRCIVATDVGGVPEVVTDGFNGRLVRPDDPAALAAALQEAVKDREQAFAWGKAARETVRLKFRKDVMLESLASIYEGGGR